MKNKTWMIALAVILFGVGVYFLLFYDKNDDAAAKTAQAQATADSLDALDSEIAHQREKLRLEAANPADFVDVQIDPKKNLFGESVIAGTLRNKSTGTSYKDFALMIYWNDETGTVMDSAMEVIFEGLDPGESVDFKTKRMGPRKSKSIEVRLQTAKTDAP